MDWIFILQKQKTSGGDSSSTQEPEVEEDNRAAFGAVGSAGASETGQDVGIGVIAPETAALGETIMVQVAADLAEGLAEAIEKARKLDAVNNAVERGRLVLRNVKAGAELAFHLTTSGLQLDNSDSVQSYTWNGDSFVLQFFVSVPDKGTIGPRVLRLIISVDGRPVGRIGFMLNIVSEKRSTAMPAKTVPHGYSQFFVSYSDKDFEQVLPRVQGLRIAELDCNVHFFFDKVSLVPGERYEAEIFDYIDNRADAFLLFWSANSAASEWVEKEWRRALVRQKEKDGLPDIIPVPLDHSAPPPPQELSDLHFTDSLLLLSASHQSMDR